MDGYAVRIAFDFEKIMDIITYPGEWYKMADQIICYQHPGPPAARTHCHLLIINPTHCVRSFKDKSGLPNGGNAQWSFKPIVKGDFAKYITYMSKGIYDPSSADCRGSNSAQIQAKQFDELKAKWITKPSVVKLSASQRDYQEWLAKFKTKAQYEALVENKDNILPKGDPLENIIKRDAANWLIAKNNGFYNQNVANQIVNFTRSFIYELNYRV